MNNVPAAPPYPTYPGFNVPGYCRLIHSLPEEEKRQLELDQKLLCDEEVNLFAISVNLCNRLYVIDTNLARRVTVTALKALQRDLVTVNQVASFHLLDGAVRDLITHSAYYLINKKIVNGTIHRESYACVVEYEDLREDVSNLIGKYTYDTIVRANEQKMSKWDRNPTSPLLQSYFHLNLEEWAEFCKLIQNSPKSEQIYYTINAPILGCWSPIVAKIQEIINPLQTQKILAEHSEGLTEENVMIVPSFTMLQVFLNVRAHGYKREPVELLPTFYRLDANDYARVKYTGQIPISLYYPEANPLIRYQWSNKNFKGVIDGYNAEGPFASALHDVYHALRELEMTKKMRDASYYLATLAEHHPKNCNEENSRPVSELLIDGELIFCYPHIANKVFKGNSVTTHITDNKFGDIFYIKPIKNRLHEDLKRDMIKDMVEHRQDWREHFDLGREDLLEAEQAIYDSCISPSCDT